MGNTVNYIHATNFISLLDTPCDQRNYENKVESRKNGIAILYDKFSWLLFFYIEPKWV